MVAPWWAQMKTENMVCVKKYFKKSKNLKNVLMASYNCMFLILFPEWTVVGSVA